MKEKNLTDETLSKIAGGSTIEDADASTNVINLRCPKCEYEVTTLDIGYSPGNLCPNCNIGKLEKEPDSDSD